MIPEKDPPPVLDPAALARAEAALAALHDRFVVWAEADLVRIETVLTDLLSCPPGAGGPSARRLFTVAHDLKGQAATFGYPLAGAICDRLCRRIDGAPDPGPDDRECLIRLVTMLGRAIRDRLGGDGGPAGLAMSAALAAL